MGALGIINGRWPLRIGLALALSACSSFDADGDGFFVDPSLCGSPLYDCDDSNIRIGNGEVYYADCDEDGFGNPDNLYYICGVGVCQDNVLACDVVSNNLDCNDRQPDASSIMVLLYPDCDEDGMGDPSRSLSFCPGTDITAPADLAACPLVQNSDDCDDNPAAADYEPGSYLYFDCDGDDFGDERIGPMYICPGAAELPITTSELHNGDRCELVEVGGDCEDDNRDTVGGPC